MKQTATEEDRLTPSYPWRNQELVKIQKLICNSQCSRIYIQDLIVAKFDFMKFSNKNEKTPRKLGSEAPLWENPKQMRLFYKISYIVNLISAILVLVFYAFIILTQITGSLNGQVTSNSTSTDSTSINTPIPANTTTNSTTTSGNTMNINTSTTANTTTSTNDSTKTNTTTSTDTTIKGKMLRFIDDFIIQDNFHNKILNEFGNMSILYNLTKDGDVNFRKSIYIENQNDENNNNIKQTKQSLLLNKSIDIPINSTNIQAFFIIKNDSEINRNGTNNKIEYANNDGYFKKREKPKFGYFLQTNTSASINKTDTTIPVCLQEFIDFQGCGKKILQDILIIIGGLVLIVNSAYNNLISKVKYASDDEWFTIYLVGVIIVGVLVLINVIQYTDLIQQSSFINDYNSTINSADCTTEKSRVFGNRTDFTGYVMELKVGCSYVYKTIFALTTMNTVCITAICAVQAAMIIFKFFHYFIRANVPEEAHATMSDKKVVVHST